MAKIFENDNTKIMTGEVRASYLHVFEPHSSQEGQEPQYSMSMIIRKDDKATIKAIETAIKNATEKGVNTVWGGKLPKKLHNPLRDGDEERDDDVYADAMFINANSKKRKPGVINTQKETLYSSDEFKSGDYCKVVCRFYPYSANGNNGIACALDNIMMTREGEALGGGAASAESDFEGEYEEEDDLL